MRTVSPNGHPIGKLIQIFKKVCTLSSKNIRILPHFQTLNKTVLNILANFQTRKFQFSGVYRLQLRASKGLLSGGSYCEYHYWVVVKNNGFFLGTLNIRCRIIIGTQKGTTIFTTTHYCSYTYCYYNYYLFLLLLLFL